MCTTLCERVVHSSATCDYSKGSTDVFVDTSLIVLFFTPLYAPNVEFNWPYSEPSAALELEQLLT